MSYPGYSIYNQALASAQMLNPQRLARAGYVKLEVIEKYLRKLPEEYPTLFQKYNVQNSKEFMEELIELLP